jgi:hypothetical protein
LSELNRGRFFIEREIDVLVLTTMLTGYFDFAMELIDSFYKGQDKDLSVELVKDLSTARKDQLMRAF